MRTELALERGTIDGERVSLTEADFDAFYRRNARALSSYLHRMVGDGAAADDLSQKAWIQFYRAPLDSREEPRMRGLLYRVATNLGIDFLRRRKREREGFFFLGRREGARDDRELHHDLGRAFERITPRERSLLWLAYVEGFDHREIASIAALDEKSVKVLLFRARRRLAAVCRAMGLGPEVMR
ncbi:MAG TPA: RNA polymerase sigma factor [Thermoanaerobaculia bacterium]|nr:RNA polymerase sigma factor [Thermoanaerobaculia bacterium]